MALFSPQLNAALMMDAVVVVAEGLSAMLRKNDEVFRGIFRRGVVKEFSNLRFRFIHRAEKITTVI